MLTVGKLTWSLALGVACGCAKPAAPDEKPEAPPPLRPAPAGVLVTRMFKACATLPCASGKCAVACPPQTDMLRVDITEPLQGEITVRVDGVTVASVRAFSSMTGLTFDVGVRPLRWPAAVDVRVGQQFASVVVEREKPFVATRSRSPDSFTFESRAEPFWYE